MELYNVAKFFNVSPQEIEDTWLHLDYMDRLEYMNLSQYYETKELERMKNGR